MTAPETATPTTIPGSVAFASVRDLLHRGTFTGIDALAIVQASHFLQQVVNSAKAEETKAADLAPLVSERPDLKVVDDEPKAEAATNG